LINRIGVKTIHPKHSQSCHCEERQPRGNPARTVAHKHRPPPCIRTSDHPLSLRATKWRGNPAEPSVTRGYPHSPWIAASGLKETLLAMTKSYYIIERV
ncbi:MAG: hypothetical protein O3A82_17445, partial [Verrucomicrobia bacterium]|nr:hypothetical protein [Verrucomicrobiota bacterium]